VATTAQLQAGKDVETPGRGTAALGYRQGSDTRVSALNSSLEALWGVTGEGSKVTRQLRSVPKIKWNKSGPGYGKQHVHIYKYETFTFVLHIYFLI